MADNLAALAEEAAERLGERKSMDFDGETITNFETLSRSRRFHRAFSELGVARGDHICISMLNHPFVYGIFGGLFRTGGTAVPVMAQLTVREMNYIFGHTEAKGIVTDSVLIDKVREAIKGLDHIEWIAIRGGETNEAATPKEYSLEGLLEQDEQPSIANIDPGDIALMLYTSGTTGRPKGVMLSHANLIAQAEAGLDASEFHARPHPAIGINALPMAHIFGVGVMVGGYITPSEIEPGYIVQEAAFEPERFMAKIQEHRCTDVSCVPTMMAMMMSHPNNDQYDMSSLLVISVGAAPVPVDLSRAISEKYDCRIRQLYGMTENAGLATCDRISKPYRPGSAGLPYKDVDLRIFDDNDNEMPAGQAGEIVTRGPSTMQGYFKQPDETAETMRGGWLHTGDVGYLDDEGWLFVVDRKKDMIIKGGENIFPAEIENILYEHEGIAEAAVVGAPDEKFGETVVAYVVPMADVELDAAEIISRVKESVTPFKAPSRVYIISELPKSGVGKILRRELRDRAAKE